MLQVQLIGMINEKAGAIFNCVDDRYFFAFRNGRTSLAAANIALCRNVGFIYITGTMYNNGPLPGIVINAFFDAYQFQRIAIIT